VPHFGVQGGGGEPGVGFRGAEGFGGVPHFGVQGGGGETRVGF